MKRVWKYLSFGALAAVILAMVAATVLEKLRGSESALEQVYHSPWFIALWGVLAGTGLALILGRKAFRRGFTLSLHLAFALILAGALVTHLCGESGMLHLREGEEASSFEKEDGEDAPLGFALRLERFTIDY